MSQTVCLDFDDFSEARCFSKKSENSSRVLLICSVTNRSMISGLMRAGNLHQTKCFAIKGNFRRLRSVANTTKHASGSGSGAGQLPLAFSFFPSVNCFEVFKCDDNKRKMCEICGQVLRKFLVKWVQSLWQSRCARFHDVQAKLTSTSSLSSRHRGRCLHVRSQHQRRACRSDWTSKITAIVRQWAVP